MMNVAHAWHPALTTPSAPIIQTISTVPHCGAKANATSWRHAKQYARLTVVKIPMRFVSPQC
jgi:hypothetical protein